MRRFACLLLVWLLAVAVSMPGCDWLNPSDCPPMTGTAVYSGDGVGGGAGGATDDGFGGSDVGVGAGGSDVGVGAGPGAGVGAGAGSSADVGAGAGPGSSADVGAGAGPGVRTVPRHPRRAHWRWHWHTTDPKDGPIGTAIEAICVPKLSLFTTTRLRQVAAANGIGAGLTGIAQSRQIGLWFETWALTTINVLPDPPQAGPNTMPFFSQARQTANAKSGGLPKSVIPEFVANLYLSPEASFGAVTFPMSQFWEVKAVTGNMTFSTRQYQIAGLVDVASQSPAGVSTVPMHPPAQLIFITTGNTTIGNDVIARATALGVAIWQGTVWEDLNTPPSNPMLYLNGPGCLNPSVYLPATPAVAASWPPSTLTSPGTQLTVIDGDPDPPEVD